MSTTYSFFLLRRGREGETGGRVVVGVVLGEDETLTSVRSRLV